MNIFDQARVRKPKSNLFDLSHEKKLTMCMGNLVPVYLEEILPGDKIKVRTEALIRLAPLVAPMMHRVNVYMHYFFVPNRLVMDDWEKFITGGEDGLDATPFPYYTINEQNRARVAPSTLADYLGVPTPDDTLGAITANLNINALPFRGYNLIWNEYYRSQDLQAERTVPKTSTVNQGVEPGDMMDLLQRAWEKDYFTSCLPNAQKGADVEMPISLNDSTTPSRFVKASDQTSPGAGVVASVGAGAVLQANGVDAILDNSDNLRITINDLRRSVKLQEWLEKNARAGSRYVESLLVHWGVISPDARLQRPEYLGGGKFPIVVSEVLQTADTANGVVGTMAGHGISVGNVMGFNKKFTEHGFVFGIMSVLPRTGYVNNLERFWTRSDKFDFAWPEFANLGEQDVLKGEVAYDWQDATQNAEVFGYQSRFSELKFKNSTVHGYFKNSMAPWHMARFIVDPELNEDFIQCFPTTDIYSIIDDKEQPLWIQLYNDVKAVRPLPYFGTPSL